MFLQFEMPQVAAHLHFRNYDVSTNNEFYRSCYHQYLSSPPSKNCGHRSLPDIMECIEELRYYKEMFSQQMINEEVKVPIEDSN